MARHSLGILLFAVAVAMIAFTDATPPAAGQKKNNDREEQMLRQKINALQNELREREQTINRLQTQLKKEKNEKEDKQIADLQKDLSQAQSALREKETIIANLKKADAKEDAATGRQIEDLKAQVKALEAMRKSPYVHTVVLKLRKDAPPGTLKDMLHDAPNMLGKIPGVRGLWYGQRAEETSPEFAVKDFEVSLVLLFDNADGLKKYLDHPQHQAFLKKYIKHVETPLVYDAQRPNN